MSIPTRYVVAALLWGENRSHVYQSAELDVDFLPSALEAQERAKERAEEMPGLMFAVMEITGIFTGEVKVNFESA